MIDKKMRHDILGAVRTLGLAVQDIKNGYKFDDESAPEKISILEEIARLLERELPALISEE